MAEGIAQGVTGQQPVWNQASPAWNQVFMTYHPDGDPSHNSSEWIPDQGIIDGPTGEGDSLKTAVTCASGNMALVYFSNNSQTKIKNTLNKTAVAHWFDPHNGQAEQAGQFKQNEVRDIVPPENWEDAILILRVRE